MKVSRGLLNLFLYSSISVGLCSGIQSASAEDKILATYKNGEVKESQVMEQFKPILEMQPAYKGKNFDALDANLQEAIVRGFVNIKLLEQEAINLKIESSKEVQDKLNQVKAQLVQQEVIDRHIKSVITDNMVDDEYKKLTENLKGKEEIKVSHILLETKEKAEEVRKKLNKGSKFNALAKEFSKDDESKARGGELGYILQGQLVPEFENKAFAMKVNEVSEPVKTNFGWHIIKLLDKRPAQIPSKKDAKQSIMSKLAKEAVERYFIDLSNKFEVKISIPKKAVTEDQSPK